MLGVLAAVYHRHCGRWPRIEAVLDNLYRTNNPAMEKLWGSSWHVFKASWLGTSGRPLARRYRAARRKPEAVERARELTRQYAPPCLNWDAWQLSAISCR